MNRALDPTDCWPNQDQERLLQAALVQGKTAIEAWEQWKASVDIEHLDVGSHRLLPLLYRNLHAQGIDDPSLKGRLKGVYRRTWYDNQLLFHQVSILLRSFRDAGIETIVLKGAALALLHYKDLGLRPMNDLDVMVRVNQRSEAIALMEELGWYPMPRSPEAVTESYLSIVNSHGFAHSTRRECDLHWHLFPECCQADADDDFWEQSVPFQIQDAPTRALAPTDQLLHICVHGAEWNPVPPMRWAADAVMIMNTAAIDWHRLLAQARKRGLTLPLRDTLEYLRSRLAAPVPLEVMQSLDKIPVTPTELAEYKYKTENFEQKPFGYLPLLWFRYLRLEGSDSPRHKFIGFAKYLMRFWGAERLRQLPSYAAFMAKRRIRAVSSSLIQSLSGALAATTAREVHGSGRNMDR